MLKVRTPARVHRFKTIHELIHMGRLLQARLHIESLSPKTTLPKLKNALETLSEGLDEIYDDTMDRIRVQHPDHSSLTLRFIQQIFLASRPMSIV